MSWGCLTLMKSAIGGLPADCLAPLRVATDATHGFHRTNLARPLPLTEKLMSTAPPIRVVLAKVGLDGHDRGVKVVARGLRDAGFHVIYAGLWQTPEAIVRAVADEDADWLGLSLLSGAHLTLVPRVLEQLGRAGLGHVGVIVGGTIPMEDVPKL